MICQTLGCVVLAALLRYVYRRWCHLPLPPGPRRNVWGTSEAFLPWVEPWKVYSDWSKLFGDLIYFSAWGRDIIVVNGVKATTELLEGRAAVYTRRPTWSMVTLTGREENIAFMDYTSRLRKARAIVQGAVSPRTQRIWGPLLEEETRKLICILHECPGEYTASIKRYLASFIGQFTYGSSFSLEPHLLLMGDVNKQTIAALSPGRWIVDALPFLKYLPSWLPGMGFKKWTCEAKAKLYQLTRVPYQDAKKSIADGNQPGGMVPHILHEMIYGKTRFDEDSLISAASSIVTAATDSLAGISFSFLLLMTVYKDIQERLYAEIIAVTGGKRLPSLADRPSLPFVDAVIKEIHRYNPIAPMLPRSPITEDVYQGSRIPENSWVMFNIWSMAHDPEIYSDPDTFDPYRHLSEDMPRDPRDFTFGLGKRICPGRNLADAQTFLFVSCVLTVFNIMAPLDEHGEEQPPPLAYMSGFLSPPKPFTCRLVPRDNDVARDIAL